jgi:hypothetical protein
MENNGAKPIKLTFPVPECSVVLYKFHLRKKSKNNSQKNPKWALTRGGFHKSWAQGVKRRVHQKSWRQCKNLSTRRKCKMPH